MSIASRPLGPILQIVCTIAGTLPGAHPAVATDWEEAATKLIPVSTIDAHHWNVAPYCSNTSAPDYHPVKLYDPINTVLAFNWYWVVSGCTRPRDSPISTLWTCKDNNQWVAGTEISGQTARGRLRFARTLRSPDLVVQILPLVCGQSPERPVQRSIETGGRAHLLYFTDEATFWNEAAVERIPSA